MTVKTINHQVVYALIRAIEIIQRGGLDDGDPSHPAFITYDPEERLEFADDACEARDSAQVTLEYYRDEASDGWHEDVGTVSWGIYVPVEVAAECDRRETPDGPLDYWVDYCMEDVCGE
uniref:Uncharacterized protein n=1 Tax=viral metagenome TaxID=1070528 RepID=A0A6M3LYB1_9ZZZZ